MAIAHCTGAAAERPRLPALMCGCGACSPCRWAARRCDTTSCRRAHASRSTATSKVVALVLCSACLVHGKRRLWVMSDVSPDHCSRNWRQRAPTCI
jgi:hypothetical protein